ncbi:hypothetical protein K461DRAFT_271246 [Myriangium duriaei CBS 260.36]|uniref:Uncharacterized protein n=1 Tax=Myriangium duriaei CBS 260.36 TaxID=1168546 RepID=A0A9P4MDZ1_9PEZI|nr:hypothetical protein K461DRAFT_271246 [Myriangium duriaei CBS 260.36]
MSRIIIFFAALLWAVVSLAAQVEYSVPYRHRGETVFHNTKDPIDKKHIQTIVDNMEQWSNGKFHATKIADRVIVMDERIATSLRAARGPLAEMRHLVAFHTIESVSCSRIADFDRH